MTKLNSLNYCCCDLNTFFPHRFSSLLPSNAICKMVAVKQYVSPNRGAFILWNIAPVSFPERIPLAGRIPSPSHLSSLSKSCRWLFGVWRNSSYADNLSNHWQISVFRPGRKWAHAHTCTDAHARTDTHTHRLGCYCWLVSNPHLWMVTRASGLQYSHSYLTDSRDQFPWAEEWRRVTW